MKIKECGKENEKPVMLVMGQAVHERVILKHLLNYYPENADVLCIKNQFFSDLVTAINDKIDIPDTVIHIFYAARMGKKYLKRCYRHYAHPDIFPFAYDS